MKATYKIIKLLGEGSFGKAYLAKCDNEDKKYVIKQVILDGMTDQEKRESFNEAVILKKLDHPNIIKFKEVFLQRKPNEALNIVTEFADGGDLGQKIEQQKKQPFPESQILDYITQICLALQHIHKKKIIHRDLKSGNVFLMKSGIVKLGDFGISKGLKSTWAKAKTVVGTPYYLAPEIINNKPYDSKCDIWALGILLYELMTFKMPFNAVSLPLLSIKINRGVYKPPPSTYSSDIRNLLKNCLTLNPEERPSIDDILQLPLIKERIKNFLNEVQYDQSLLRTMAKKYKDKKREERHKKKHEKHENENDKKIENDNNNKTSNTVDNSTVETKEKANPDEKKETKKLTNDTKKAKNFLANRKKDTKKGEAKLPTSGKNLPNVDESPNTTNTSLNETNFLIKKKDPNFQQGKEFKEDDIGKTLKTKGYKDLINEKNGNFDVNKMNEDQYNQLRLLNNLHNVANDLAQDSDSEISVTSSLSSLPSSKDLNEERMVEDITIQEMPKNENKEISKEKMEQCKEENNEMEQIKKEIEKEIGNDLLKEVIGLMESSCDKNEVKFDREQIIKKINELKDKGFVKEKIDKTIEKIDEIFAILMKDKIFG